MPLLKFKALLAIEYPRELCFFYLGICQRIRYAVLLQCGLQAAAAVSSRSRHEGVYAGEWIAEDVKVAYGGVAPKTIMAPKAQAAIKGQPWTGETLKKALEAVAQDVNITANAPGAAFPSSTLSSCM